MNYLKLLTNIYSNTKVIEGLSSERIVQNLIKTFSASPDLREALDVVELILVSNSSIKLNRTECVQSLLNIYRVNPLN